MTRDEAAVRSSSFRRWTVYLMTAPPPLDFVYVGCTSQLLESRLYGHRHKATPRVDIWLACLTREGVSPSIEPIHVVDDEKTGLRLEQNTIRKLAASGARLLNKANYIRADEWFGPPGKPSAAHMAIWSRFDNRVSFRAHLRRNRGPHTYARAVWHGWCPSKRAAIELSDALDIPLGDWLRVPSAIDPAQPSGKPVP